MPVDFGGLHQGWHLRTAVSNCFLGWLWCQGRPGASTHINLARLGTKKLYPLFIGPFKVVEKVNEVAYRLDLLVELKKVHPTFHVSLFRRYKDGGRSALTKPPPLMVDGNEEFEEERILTHKDLNGTRQYLVRWVGYGPESDTYFNESKLTHCREIVQKYLDSLLPEQRSGPTRPAPPGRRSVSCGRS